MLYTGKYFGIAQGSCILYPRVSIPCIRITIHLSSCSPDPPCIVWNGECDKGTTINMSRRMFSDEITTSDAFLDMPTESQLLYFHLGMQADDDGFIANTKMIQRVIGASDDSLKLLFHKKFLIPFETGVCVVKHWRINNQIRKDRYTETKYTNEKSSLFIRENGAYSMNPEGAIPVPRGHFLPPKIDGDDMVDQFATNGQPSIGKYSIGKVSIGKDSIDTDTDEVPKKSSKKKSDEPEKLSFGELQKVKLTQDEYDKLIARFGEKNTNLLIFELDTYVASKGAKYQSHYATMLNWARRKAFEQFEKKVDQEKNKKRIV